MLRAKLLSLLWVGRKKRLAIIKGWRRSPSFAILRVISICKDDFDGVSGQYPRLESASKAQA